MPDGFALQVVTPDKLLFEGEATALVLRTAEGDMTVLDGHTSLIGSVVPGVVRVDPQGAEGLRVVVHGGFVDVSTAPGEGGGLTTRVTLLASVAELADEIDVERARRSRQAAQEALSSSPARDDGAEVDAASQLLAAQLERAELRLEATGASSS
ncbi:MAG: ATP synthase F1 subunit epsilon [Acidimicrobiales bacterium]